MTKFLTICTFGFLLTFWSCPGRNLPYEGEDGVVKYEMHGKYHNRSLDSLIVADSLPDVDTWVPLSYRDDETKEAITNHIYVRGNNTYAVSIVNKDSVMITKRNLKEDK